MKETIKSSKIIAENTDKCIKKAISMQQQFHLPSNFSYKMMGKINEKILLEEKRREKRTFIAIIITSLSMLVACIYIILDHKKITLTDITNYISNITIPSDSLFYLPMLVSLPLLFWFNYWLRKKYGHLLKN